MHEILKKIRVQLRLAMNGVVSSSMREKGLIYKLNFGVLLPQIKEIAQTLPSDSDLADALWKEDVREMKILATLIQPKDEFSKEKAQQWVEAVQNQEIAEQYCLNLLQKLPFAEELSVSWIFQNEGNRSIPITGFILFARLSMKGHSFSSAHINDLISQAKKAMEPGQSSLQRSALLALKKMGSQSPEYASLILSAIADYPTSDSLEKQEFYEDLKFEFDYYL